MLLIQSGVDVNLRDKQGCIALHYVKSKTVLKVIHHYDVWDHVSPFARKVLLKANSDPLIKNKHGKTPRQYYQEEVDVYDIDPFIVKTLRDLEEAFTKEKLQKDLEAIELNKHQEEEKKKADFLAKRKGKVLKY